MLIVRDPAIATELKGFEFSRASRGKTERSENRTELAPFDQLHDPIFACVKTHVWGAGKKVPGKRENFRIPRDQYSEAREKFESSCHRFRRPDRVAMCARAVRSRLECRRHRQ